MAPTDYLGAYKQAWEIRLSSGDDSIEVLSERLASLSSTRHIDPDVEQMLIRSWLDGRAPKDVGRQSFGLDSLVAAARTVNETHEHDFSAKAYVAAWKKRESGESNDLALLLRELGEDPEADPADLGAGQRSLCEAWLKGVRPADLRSHLATDVVTQFKELRRSARDMWAEDYPSWMEIPQDLKPVGSVIFANEPKKVRLKVEIDPEDPELISRCASLARGEKGAVHVRVWIDLRKDRAAVMVGTTRLGWTNVAKDLGLRLNRTRIWGRRRKVPDGIAKLYFEDLGVVRVKLKVNFPD